MFSTHAVLQHWSNWPECSLRRYSISFIFPSTDLNCCLLFYIILFCFPTYSNSLFHVYMYFSEIFNPFFLDIADVLCTILNTFAPKFRIFWTLRPPLVGVKFSGSGRVRWAQRDPFTLSLSCLKLVSTCQWRKARHRCDGGTCHSYCEFLFLCSFSLFIVLNIGSHGNHSNSKTGGCIDVEDNGDDHDDDAINGGGEKKRAKTLRCSHSSAAAPAEAFLSHWFSFFSQLCHSYFLSFLHLSFLLWCFFKKKSAVNNWHQ